MMRAHGIHCWSLIPPRFPCAARRAARIEGSNHLALNRAAHAALHGMPAVARVLPGKLRRRRGLCIDGTRLTLLNLCPTPAPSLPPSLTPDEKSLVFAEYALGHADELISAPTARCYPIRSPRYSMRATARTPRVRSGPMPTTPTPRRMAAGSPSATSALIRCCYTTPPLRAVPGQPNRHTSSTRHPAAGPRHLCFPSTMDGSSSC